MGRIFYDISQTINPGIVVYPGDPEVKFDQTFSIVKGDIVNLYNITMGSHTGTHVDAPKHFYDQGLTIDQLSMDYFIGPAKVFELLKSSTISQADLESCDIQKGDIVLLKTKNSALLARTDFDPSFTYVDPGAAEFLADVGIRTLGFDYLSIDPYKSLDFKAHYILLGRNIVIIEGLNMSAVAPGEYQMVALPLKLQDGNGSPARVVLIKDDENRTV
jgi:arylformamidase